MYKNKYVVKLCFRFQELTKEIEIKRINFKGY